MKKSKSNQTSKNFQGPARECNELAINAKNLGVWLKDNTQKIQGTKMKRKAKEGNNNRRITCSHLVYGVHTSQSTST